MSVTCMEKRWELEREKENEKINKGYVRVKWKESLRNKNEMKESMQERWSERNGLKSNEIK